MNRVPTRSVGWAWRHCTSAVVRTHWFVCVNNSGYQWRLGIRPSALQWAAHSILLSLLTLFTPSSAFHACPLSSGLDLEIGGGAWRMLNKCMQCCALAWLMWDEQYRVFLLGTQASWKGKWSRGVLALWLHVAKWVHAQPNRFISHSEILILHWSTTVLHKSYLKAASTHVMCISLAY